MWVGILAAVAATAPVSQTASLDRSGIAAFNRAFDDAFRAMNNDGILALWEDDGVSLLPDTAPVRGKAAMTAMMKAVTSALPNARMQSFTNQCFDIEGSGDWASEWCLEHQVVTVPGKPTFDRWGKMLLVLHRKASGEWRLSREMWNPGRPSDAVVPQH